jgi:DNA-binding response OmpR family regulator
MNRSDCPHCDDLQERIAYLESELGLHLETQNMAALMTAFGLRPGHCHLLLALYAARGKVVRPLQLEDAIPAKDENRDRVAKIVDVYVCFIRKMMGKDTILNIWAQGYALSPQGQTRVAAAIAQFAGVRA